MSQSVRGVISRAEGQPVEYVDIVIPDPGPGEVVVTIPAAVDKLGGESSAASGSRQHTGAMRLDWFDRKIVEFILAWAPYDGPIDDEAFPEFGMSTADLKARFVEIIAMQSLFGPEMGSDDWALLQRAHAYYLHITRQPPPSVAPPTEEGPVAARTGNTAATRSPHPVSVRYRSPSRSPQFGDAISNAEP